MTSPPAAPRRTLCALALAVSLTACDALRDRPDDDVSGRYAVLLSEAGVPVAEGTLDLRLDGTSVRGDWRLNWTEPGRETGEGAVRGVRVDDALRLSLLVGPEDAPHLDAGVGLDGTLDGGTLRGVWGEGMSDGPSGTFVARR